MPVVKQILKSSLTLLLNKLYYIFFLSFGWSLTVAAQNCFITLAGFVSDSHSGSPMEDVEAYIVELGKENWTDKKGGFLFTGLCPNTYHLIIQHVGCPPERILINISGDTTLQLSLEHHVNMLHEVDIHDKHDHPFYEEKVGLITLEENSHKSVASSITSIAGVSSISNGADIGLPVIHGLSGNRLTIINNGVVHSGQQWGADHSPEIDLNSAGEITLVSGAAGLRYPGTHMGGILILESGKIPSDPHIHGKVGSTAEFNGRGNTTNIQLYQGGGSSQWRIGSTLKYYGDRHTPTYYLKNTGTRQAHANAEFHRQWQNKLNWDVKYNYFSAQYGILRGSHIGNLTDLESAYSRAIPFYTDSSFSTALDAPRQWVRHHQFKSKFSRKIAEGEIEWHTGIQRNQRREYDVRRSGRSDIPALSLLQYSVQNELFWTDKKYIEAGYQFLGKNNWNVLETGITPLLPNYTAFTNGLFITYDRDFVNFGVEMAGRYDYTFRNIAKLSNTIPRIPLYYKDKFSNFSFLGRIQSRLSTKWQVMSEIALRQRPPEINEVYSFGLHQGVSGIEEGNINLKKESGIKSSMHLRGKLTKAFHMDVRAYAHFFDGFIYLLPLQEPRLTIRGAFPVFKYEQCDARLVGGDIVFKLNFSKRWNLSTSWAYVHGSNLTDTLPLNYMPPLNGRHVLSYEIPELKNWSGLKAELEHSYTGKQWHWDSSLDFIEPPGSYNLFNFHIGGTFDAIKSKPKFRIGVLNILNTSYRDYLNRQRYFADALGRNFTLSWIQHF